MSGAASNNRGKATDQAIARWARSNGFPGAERIVRTGYRVADRESPDGGDQWWAPGLLVQSKSLRPANRMERAVPGWLAETEAQRLAAGAEVALLVVRRDGTADVGEWWAFFEAYRLECLWAGGKWSYGGRHPVRMLVHDAAQLLRNVGYGTPLTQEASA